MICQQWLSEDIIIPVSFLIGGVLLGLLGELIIYARIRAFGAKIQWKELTIIIKAFRGIPLLWFTLFGIQGFIMNFTLDQELVRLSLQVIGLLLELSILLIVARIVNSFIELYAEKVESALATSSIFTNLTKTIFLILGFVLVIQSFGIEIGPVLTILGVSGLTVALALQPTLTNFFSGLYVLISQEFDIGDYIEIEDGKYEGYIKDMTWRHTILQPAAGYQVVIPNSQLFSSTVTNYDVEKRDIAIIIPIGVGYDSDLEKVERVTIEVAKETVKAIQGNYYVKDPYVRFHTFSPSSIDMNVMIFAKNLYDRSKIKHKFIKAIFARYQQEGIDIPYPHSVIVSKRSDTPIKAS